MAKKLSNADELFGRTGEEKEGSTE